MTDAEKYLLRQMIASALDHPSVYMGGPSPQSVRKAILIVEHILVNYSIAPFKDRKLEAKQVETWRKSPWDSLERI